MVVCIFRAIRAPTTAAAATAMTATKAVIPPERADDESLLLSPSTAIAPLSDGAAVAPDVGAAVISRGGTPVAGALVGGAVAVTVGTFVEDSGGALLSLLGKSGMLILMLILKLKLSSMAARLKSE